MAFTFISVKIIIAIMMIIIMMIMILRIEHHFRSNNRCLFIIKIGFFCVSQTRSVLMSSDPDISRNYLSEQNFIFR